MKTPVLLIGFNRPELLSELLALVLDRRVPRVYIAVDGPREHNKADLIAHTEILENLGSLPRTEGIFLRIRTTNLGCRDGVVDAINWFFSHEEEGIILEDDCFPAWGFFDYCDEMLVRYRGREDVFTVGGFRAKPSKKNESHLVFSRYPQIWGWASWRRVWDSYDKDLESWDCKRGEEWLRHEVGLKRLTSKYWSKKFCLTKNGSIDTWDYQLTLLSLKNQGLNLLPPRNLILNRGFDSRATHTLRRRSFGRNLETWNAFEARPPAENTADSRYDAWLERWSYQVWKHALPRR